MKAVALIPARGGSKRVPRKNIKLLKDKPLIWYAIDACLRSIVHEVWVSTEDKEIKKIAQGFGAKVLDRPMELASDTASTEEVMLHFTKKVEYDVIVLVEPTYPLIQPRDVNQSLNRFWLGEYDSLLTLQRRKYFIWKLDEKRAFPINYNVDSRPFYQDFEGIYVEEGGIYITTRENLLSSKCRLSGRIGYYVIKHPSIDIDEEDDFRIAEAMIE